MMVLQIREEEVLTMISPVVPTRSVRVPVGWGVLSDAFAEALIIFQAVTATAVPGLY